MIHDEKVQVYSKKEKIQKNKNNSKSNKSKQTERRISIFKDKEDLATEMKMAGKQQITNLQKIFTYKSSSKNNEY